MKASERARDREVESVLQVKERKEKREREAREKEKKRGREESSFQLD